MAGKVSSSGDVHMTEIGNSGCSDTVQLNQTVQVGVDKFSLLNIYSINAFQKISSGVSEEEYLNILGKLSAISKSAPIKMHKKMKITLLNSLINKMESMVEEEEIKDKFKVLDRLEEEFALDEGKETWRPNGDVSDHMRSHAMAVKLKHKSELEEYVRNREIASEALCKEVVVLRSQIAAIEKRLHLIVDRSLNYSVIEKLNDKIDSLL